MPNENAIFVNLRQEFGDAKYNGGIYISGQSDNDHTGSFWDDNYFTTQIAAFTALLSETINAASGDVGQWRIVVMSKSIQPQQTPVGTPLDVTEAVATNRVMTQRRRGQKVRGYAV